MKSYFLYIILVFTAFFVTLSLLAVGAPVLADTLENINSAKSLGLIEPETLLLLALGGGGMVYLKRRKSKKQLEDPS